MILTELVVLLFLTVLNGVFSMSETALISARRTRLQQLADDGDQGARQALETAENPTRFLSTVQIGITLIGILSGVFGGATLAEELGHWIAVVPLLEPYAEGISVTLVVLLITYLSLVIGELVPKNIALQYAETIAVNVARPMHLLSRITAPLNALLSLSTRGMLTLLRIHESDQPRVTLDDIRAMVREGAAAGVVDASEQSMVQNALRLDDLYVSSAMTPHTEVVWLDLNASLDENRRKIAEHPHSAYPVCRDMLDNVVGLVLSRDLLRRALNGQPFDLHSALHEPLFLPENTSAARALELIKQSGAHLGLVVNEYGGVEGLVNVKDLMQEVIGDLNAAEAVQRADGSWLLDGLMHSEDVRERLELDQLPGESENLFRTLGGFVMARLERIPRTGDLFAYGGYQFEVIDMDGKRVDKVLVTRLASPVEDSTEGSSGPTV